MKDKYQHARNVLLSLIQGTDPDTGAGLPSESVLQRADVIRVFLLCQSALKRAEAREARRTHLPHNIGKPWSATETQQLRDSVHAGTSIAEIATAHGRTVRAIKARIEVLGLQIDGQHAPHEPKRGDER